MEREYCKICSHCRARAVVIADVPYETKVNYDGRLLLVRIVALSVPRCAECGNFSLDHAASEQITRAFRDQAGILQPEQIRQERERIGLSQAALAEIVGVELEEIVWWENGERSQSRIADQFLRAIFAVPDLHKALHGPANLKEPVRHAGLGPLSM